MASQTSYITDPEEIRLFLDRYPRLDRDQLLIGEPVLAGMPLPVTPCPVVRGLIEASDPKVQKIALHLMAVFNPRDIEDEPRLCLEYFSRGFPDPQGIPPVFFSVGAREYVWAQLLLQTGVLALKDRRETACIVRLEKDQVDSVRVFLIYALAWCTRQGIDLRNPYQDR